MKSRGLIIGLHGKKKWKSLAFSVFKLLKLQWKTSRVAHELMCNKRAKSSSSGAHDVIFYSCFPLFIVKKPPHLLPPPLAASRRRLIHLCLSAQRKSDIWCFINGAAGIWVQILPAFLRAPTDEGVYCTFFFKDTALQLATGCADCFKWEYHLNCRSYQANIIVMDTLRLHQGNFLSLILKVGAFKRWPVKVQIR